ncbi:response regulator transcription factor [Exilibacterium tricleocarpae]|uniref:Response regulator transcription factor n=2 Tax=Exilibacterium tricleocarpae TaxID=2591008 RepID=A0A545TFS7_9GAMM|nr:response regulator transcription factor [Exilibacterium tricleocarpae]
MAIAQSRNRHCRRGPDQREHASKILFIQNNTAFNNRLSEILGKEGYQVDACIDEEECLNLASTLYYQLVILDVMLPQTDGFSLLRKLRNIIQTPVIMLTAKGAEEERIESFYHGADDCLTKPFSPMELLLRVQTLLRRSRGDLETTKRFLQVDSLYLDKVDQSASVGGRLVRFTPTEFRLLWVLVQHKGDVLKKVFLYKAVLNKTPGRYDRSIDMHLSRVRKKLSAAGWQSERLRTVHGEGYCLE